MKLFLTMFLGLLITTIGFSPPGDDDGTWTVTGDKLIIDDVLIFDIESFDCKTLVQTAIDWEVSDYKIKVVYTRQ